MEAVGCCQYPVIAIGDQGADRSGEVDHREGVAINIAVVLQQLRCLNPVAEVFLAVFQEGVEVAGR